MKLERKIREDFLDSMLHYLETLMSQKDYAGAVAYYESHRNELQQSGIAAGAIYHTTSKAYASLTQLQQALKTARLAQNSAMLEGNDILLANNFITIGSILRDMSEFKEAEKAYRDAESIFRRNDSLEGQSRALNILAGLFFKQTDYNNALSVLVDAIEIAKKLDDKKKLAFMMGNIGRVYSFTGNFSEAKKHLLTAIELSEKLADDIETARGSLSLGYIYLQEANYTKAEAAFDKAYPLIINAQSERDEVYYLTYVGELQYRKMQFEESKTNLEKALVLAESIAPDSILTARTLRHLAELSIIESQVNKARQYTSRAWVIFEKASDKVELGALLKIKAQIAQLKDDKNKSIKLFVQSIEMLSESGVRFEKAEALIAAGKSKLFTPRQRLTYLFRAEEFYSSCGLTQKLQQIEKLISSVEQTSQHAPVEIPTQAGICPDNIEYLTSDNEINQFKTQLPLLGHTNLPVLLMGETGVGKDHMARYFHHAVRPTGPYIAINCASLPETLLESELFGYVRGAFTGADKNKEGLFVAANTGVLFLDEIGDMPLSLQTKLLSVLENRKVVPLGSTKTIELDIKLIAATNQNLEEMVEQGKFRRDLYYRLSGITFTIPPLRNRKGDIPLLLEKFMIGSGLLKDSQKLEVDFVRQFIAYDWPGNTRELFNKVKRLEVMTMMVSEGDLVELSRSMFKDDVIIDDKTLFDKVEEFERKIIVEALLAANGNKSEVARMLGIHEATVRTKLKRYDITSANYQMN